MSVELAGRWRDLDVLLERNGNIVGQDFEPGPELRQFLNEQCRQGRTWITGGSRGMCCAGPAAALRTPGASIAIHRRAGCWSWELAAWGASS